MQKMIKRQMFVALLLFFIELLGIVSLVFFSKLYPEFKYNDDIMVIFVCVVVVIDLLYISSVLSRISSSRKKNDITAVEIVGEGVEEIYNFGQLGVIIVDDSNNVIWTNDVTPYKKIKVRIFFILIIFVAKINKNAAYLVADRIFIYLESSD